MGEHALCVTPQPCDDQFLVVTCWKVDEAVDSAPYPRDAAGLQVVRKQWGRIACGCALLGGEQTLLGGGDIV